jgi:hypothetical protein
MNYIIFLFYQTKIAEIIIIYLLVGAQQGDPCGPMIFSLAIQPIILSLNSELNIWYLDDGTLADYPEVVLSDFKKVINLSRKIGLELNFNKCEIFSCSG